MISINADNRQLTSVSKYSFLMTNYSSGVSTVYILNATDSDFAANAYVLLGVFGSEDAEIMKISSVNSTTGQIVFTTVTKFAHSESTRMSVLPYNQVSFYYTTTTTFTIGSATLLSAFNSIQASDWFTTYNDEAHSTGYGWYIFYNDVTAIYSQNSNAIPYAGFGRDTVEDALNDFFSLLSNKELKLVTRRDALSWLNEGYSIIRNKLNLTNLEYTASALSSFSIVSGTIEYDLPDDFDHLVSIVSGLNSSDPGGGSNFTKRDIEYISLKEAYSYTGIAQRYYIRGTKIGFVPTPGINDTYNYIYLAKTTRLALNSDQITLPNTGAYIVKDFMMYRACLKFQNPLSATYYKAFNDNLNQMIVASIKRDASLPRFGITRESNV